MRLRSATLDPRHRAVALFRADDANIRLLVTSSGSPSSVPSFFVLRQLSDSSSTARVIRVRSVFVLFTCRFQWAKVFMASSSVLLRNSLDLLIKSWSSAYPISCGMFSFSVGLTRRLRSSRIANSR